jgi:uncharacterized protein (TIGR03437 family)
MMSICLAAGAFGQTATFTLSPAQPAFTRSGPRPSEATTTATPGLLTISSLNFNGNVTAQGTIRMTGPAPATATLRSNAQLDFQSPQPFVIDVNVSNAVLVRTSAVGLPGTLVTGNTNTLSISSLPVVDNVASLTVTVSMFLPPAPNLQTATDEVRYTIQFKWTLSQAQNRSCIFTLTSISGEVAYRRSGGDWIPVVAVPTTVCDGDELFTGVESSAVVSGVGDSGTRSVQVEELTQVLLIYLTSDKGVTDWTVHLALGKINANVKKDKVVDTNFEVQTPVSTTSVRGTILNVRYDPESKASTINVEEGEVVVTGAKAPFPVTAPPGLPLTVLAGQRVRITADAVGPVGTNPAITAGGVVDAAGFRAPLARGEIASVFGTNFTASSIAASAVPLPLELGGASVRINGVRAPLIFVSPGQINFQVPQNVPLNGEVEVTVESEGAPSPSQRVAVQSYAPGIFTYVRTAGVVDPIVIHADGSLVTPQSPAERGETLVIFATGVGDLTNAPGTNQLAPSSPLAESRVKPEVTMGGAPAEVLFTGLTPGFIGLIQINVNVPIGAPSGNVPLVFGYGSAVSQPGLNLAVR